MKRNRKPSEKVLELQAEKVKKPSKASKSSKPKSKSLADKSNAHLLSLNETYLSKESLSPLMAILVQLNLS
ncbi:hypothetical protein P8452_67501 [Trifolium repens]|nr:hypothetical protein P8452_67501 [Trifolium repens]